MNSQRSITILFLGDVIGKPGRAVIKRYLKEANPGPDLIIANAENAAHGFGTTQSNLTELREAGVIAFTGGNHTFDRKETLDFIDGEVNVLRPANYPEGTPGKGHCIVDAGQIKLGILNLIGRVFMEPLRSPFAVAEELLPGLKEKTNLILVDIHAEATAEKVAMGWYLDGRVSAVIGSHTHVQTADERILPNGTAYITDVGCCGPENGVIGMERESVFRRMIKQLPTRLEVANGPAMVNGVLIEIETATGKSLSIKRVQFHEDAYSYGPQTP
jgi:2',3'-cyclic-nucleotide 2'-phosphodiesterase